MGRRWPDGQLRVRRYCEQCGMRSRKHAAAPPATAGGSVAWLNLQCCTSKLTIDADIRFAMVPASMARKPSFANSERLLGASAPMPPIWMPIDEKFAKPQRAKVAIVTERG